MPSPYRVTVSVVSCLGIYLFRSVERLAAAGAAPEAPEQPPLRPQQVRVLVHSSRGRSGGRCRARAQRS